MPFNSGGQTYQGGNFLFQGLASAGQGVGKGVADALDKIDQNRKLDSYNDEVVQHSFNAGQISHEDYDKYLGSSRTQKTGIAAGIAANFIEDVKREQLNSLQEQRQAQAEETRQKAAAFNFTPQIVNLPSSFDQQGVPYAQPVNPSDQVLRPGVQMIEKRKGVWEPADAGGSGQDPVVTDPVVINGVTIPGIGSNRKTGQYLYYGTGSQNVQIDEKTGLPFWVDRKGDRHFLSTQQVMAGNMMPSTSGTPPPAAPSGGGINDILNNIFGAFGGTWDGGGPPPTATPAPSAAPAPSGAESLPAATPAPAGASPAAVAPMPAAKVKVKSPDGKKIGYIPAAQLEAAVRQGYIPIAQRVQ